MFEFLFSKLPFDLIREILLYNSYFVLNKKNKLLFIGKLDKKDIRYTLFRTIPKVYELSYNSWSVILECENKKKYIIRHYLRPSLIWEYSFVTYSKDPHTNMMRSIPDTMIYVPLYQSDMYI